MDINEFQKDDESTQNLCTSLIKNQISADDAKVSKMMECFTMNEGFADSKRFERYIKKTKDYLFESYMKRVFRTVFCNSDDCPVNFEDAVQQFFKDMYHQLRTQKKKYINQIKGYTKSMFEFVGGYAMLSDKALYENIDWKCSYIEGNCEKLEGIPSFEELLKSELKLVLQRHITSIYGQDENICEGNYFHTLVSDNLTAHFIFTNLVDAIHINIELMSRDGRIRDFIDTPEASVRASELEKEKNALTLQIDSLKEECDEKDKEIENLKKQFDAFKKSTEGKTNKPDENISEKIDSLNEQCRILRRTNEKLKDDFNRIAEKYQLLKETMKEEGKDEVNPDDCEYIDVDPNGRYIFFAEDKTSFKQNVLEEFPNAVFHSSTTSLSNVKADMVIVITSHIDHSVYNSARNQCVSNNIPFIHSKHTNVDAIKELMWEMLNFGRCKGYRKAVDIN